MIKKIVTHDGRFHADDVFAVATLQIFFEKYNKGLDGDAEKVSLEIVRTRDEEGVAIGDIVVDVGGVFDEGLERFDHHQGGIPSRVNGVPYASFGLVWRKYGKLICGEKIAEKIDKKLVQIIDAGDCGYELFKALQDDVEYLSFDSMFRTLYKPMWDEESQEAWYGGFLKAVALAQELLEREILIAEKDILAISLLKEVYDKQYEKEIIFLDTKIPIIGEVVDEWQDTYYIISERLSGDFGIKAVRLPGGGAFENKLSFPVSWRGLRDEELENMSGVMGAKFCHLTGYYAVAKTKEGAHELARKSLEIGLKS